MLKNILKTTLRNFSKEKFYTLLNISGLTLGLTCSLFLIFYVQHELSYDRYHQNADKLYRVVSYIQEPDNDFTWAVAQIPLAQEILDNYPDVENAGRFFNIGRNMFIIDDESFYEEDGEVFLADSTVLQMFSYDFIYGDPNTALDQPNNIILTRSLAIKYFGTPDVLGRQIVDQDDMTFSITGIIEDIPDNSHLKFSALISRSTVPEWQGSWGNFGVYTYVQIEQGTSLDHIESLLADIIKEKVSPIFDPIGITIEYQIQKITDIHLKSKVADEAESAGDMSYIYIFSIVALFMVVIASINYMNLATARATKRAKEVGIRKVVGSNKNLLIAQFLSESALTVLIAALLSVALIYLILPGFNDISGKSFEFLQLFNLNLILPFVGILILVAILSGLYPAYYLSSFKPLDVIKAQSQGRRGNQILRKALVVFQFAISVFMLISTLIVYNQLDYIRNKDLGFSHDQVIRLELSERPMRGQYPELRNSLLQLPDIKNVASSGASPGLGIGKVILNVEDKNGQMVEKGINLYRADFDYLNVLEMQLAQGRDFSRDIPADTATALLVNEAMVERMAWDNPLGKKFELGSQDGPVTYQVIGVVKDYHQNSLYDVIEPLMFFFGKNLHNVLIKLDTRDLKRSVASIEEVWKSVYPDKPFEYVFLDESFDEQYQADQKRGTLFTVFSGITIFIACLGLLGLASYTTEQRSKEIGIRKVVGASLSEVLLLLMKEFVLLTIIAGIVAVPLAYYFMGEWLQTFAYRIALTGEVGTFVLSILVGVLITLVTVGFHAYRAASSNPVVSLKEE